MKFIYFDACAGLSGDMILGALLDLGTSRNQFKKKMAELKLPVSIEVKETKRGGLRGLKVDVRVRPAKSGQTRRWKDVEGVIRGSTLSNSVKEKALAVFRTLFEAEARVHGNKLEAAHLHEAAADDALVDVLGCCYLAEELDIGRVYCSPLNVGRGWVKTTHGRLPVPPPAVAEILRKAPVYSAWAKEELVTPTGAAIVATWAEKYIPFPEMTYEKIGYGAGTRDFEDFPNILRVFYGEEKAFNPGKSVYQVEANLDDASPQVLAHFTELALRAGALDVYLTPVVMKKGRPGTKLTLLADVGRIDALVEAVFRETSSIGVRIFPVERKILSRTIKRVRVLGEEIGIKVAALGGEEINVQPEFSDCVAAAGKKKIPVKFIIQRALAEYFRKKRE
ncbi:MAG: nickel pincer cofactor biosynthesis protein LarC [Candidatus Aminicenantes bacterium]|nr:nickel pincer cofactor biosynthesis protein LarC [Candidatus Aminicenantes bacterium]